MRDLGAQRTADLSKRREALFQYSESGKKIMEAWK
jgi:hypothetical protein